MTLLLTEDVFQSLHPFSCVTDQHGRALMVGRSLAKLVPQLRPGESLWEHLRLVQPELDYGGSYLESLVGELIVVESASSATLKFRGHIVHIPTPPVRYLFALQPAAASSRELADSGLNLSDFVLGDPVFDFILLVRQLELANERLDSTVAELKLDRQFSELLCELASDLFQQDCEVDIYRRCLRLVCERLGWSAGQVVLLDLHNSELQGQSLWYARDATLRESVRPSPDSLRVMGRQEIPPAVSERAEVVWVSEQTTHKGMISASESTRTSSADSILYPVVWIPIVVDGEVIAAMRYVGDISQQYTRSYAQFFDLLSHQVAQAIVHARAHDAERRRVAAMAHAAKMATLGEIAAGVAHEVNNPLSTASLIATLLKRSVASGVVSTELVDTQVGRLELCIKRITTIVSELQGFSRDAARDPFRHEPLQKILAETLDLCGAGFSSKNISLMYNEIPSTWRIWCRASQISQVLLNLLSNAQDAVRNSADRWVRIDCGECHNHYEISVSDSGPGVPETIRHRVMTPFFTTKEPGRGTGLGLSVSANIMVDHGGLLYLDEKACNTRFVARIPKTPPPNVQIEQSAQVTSSSNV